MRKILNEKELLKMIVNVITLLTGTYKNFTHVELLTEGITKKVKNDFNYFSKTDSMSNGHFTLNGLQIFYNMYFDSVRTYSEKTNKYTSEKFNPYFIELFVYESMRESKPNNVFTIGAKRDKKATEKTLKNNVSKVTEQIKENIQSIEIKSTKDILNKKENKINDLKVNENNIEEVESMENNKIYIAWDDKINDTFIGTGTELKEYKDKLTDIKLLSDFDIEKCIDDIKALCKNKNNIEIVVEGIEISIYLNNEVYARWNFATENIDNDILLKLYIELSKLEFKVTFLNDLSLEIAATQEDPQIEKWNNKLSTDTAIQRQINTLKKVINKRKKETPLLNFVPCNGYIISKLLQLQGEQIQYSKTDFKKCYYIVSESTPEAVKIAFKDVNNNLHYYIINTTQDIKEEFYSNNDIENKEPTLKMNLQALATKELKPIFNTNIQGHEEYQKKNLNLYNSNSLAFEKKRVTNKMIEEFTKYFIYKNNRFMSVKPCKSVPSGYSEHVKKNYDLTVDTENKIVLCIEK